jgi:prepilin-type N-terminal cleavage/methylation domain-containing protein
MDASGLTLPEVLITIAIIGILAGVAINSFLGNVEYAREGVTVDSSASLNRAVNHYVQIAGDIGVEAQAGTADEVEVIQLLQARDANLPGSPYIPAEFVVSASSDSGKIRIVWSGEYFQVIPVGVAGGGIVIAP